MNMPEHFDFSGSRTELLAALDRNAKDHPTGHIAAVRKCIRDQVASTPDGNHMGCSIRVRRPEHGGWTIETSLSIYP